MSSVIVTNPTAIQTIQIVPQTDTTTYTSGANPTNAVLKTWTFTAPANCIVCNADLVLETSTTNGGSGTVDLYASGLDNPLGSAKAPATTQTPTTRKVAIHLPLSEVATNTESKLYVANTGTLAFQVRCTVGGGDSVSIKNEYFIVSYLAVT